jgi:hypothetical protein
MKNNNLTKYGIITVFITLYLIVSTISMIHSIDFFGLSNSTGMALALATAFEIGQVAALCGILILDKANRFVIWSLFLLLTSMQIMSNVYFSFKYLGDYSQWAELFGLGEEEPLFQKRMLAIISGGVLPIVALGFIKSLVDYLKPSEPIQEKIEDLPVEDNIITVSSDLDVVNPGEKFDSTINITEELEPVIDNVKEVVTKRVEMPRTPGQYSNIKDPITGAGGSRKK